MAKRSDIVIPEPRPLLGLALSVISKSNAQMIRIMSTTGLFFKCVNNSVNNGYDTANREHKNSLFYHFPCWVINSSYSASHDGFVCDKCQTVIFPSPMSLVI